MSSVKILVVDDHALVREGLSQVLKALADEVTVLQASTCLQAFELSARHCDLDLVLLDYHLPDMTGLEALPIFRRRFPELPVLVLSGSANVQILHQALKAGAAGYIQKSGVNDELLSAVRKILDGEVFVSAPAPEIARVESEYSRLTPRQELVLKGILDGLSNKDIGDRIGISEETVKTHVAAILRYFHAQNRTQAVTTAMQQGYRPSLRRNTA